MTTFINGNPSAWSQDVWDKWNSCRASEDGDIETCNYFTPRPHLHEYDPGCTKEGFTYRVALDGGIRVGQVVINGAGLPRRVAPVRRGSL